MFSLSTLVEEIPPLFCQLDVLQHSPHSGEYTCWKEKARWIRFEEQAEEVIGRWSKPHVATIPQTAMESLKELIKESKPILNLQITENTEILECIAESLDEYFGDQFEKKDRLINILKLPHFHHHERNMEKRLSSANLHITEQRRMSLGLKNVHSSSGLFDLNQFDKKQNQIQEESLDVDLSGSASDFKENRKFNRKVNKKAEAASVLITPLDFVDKMKIVFVRMQSAVLLPSFIEVNKLTRFIVIIIGPANRKPFLYEIGRAIATILADDCCRELFYSAQSQEDILSAINQFNKNAVLIPPSEWDPKIMIEPPEHYLSKAERLAAPEITAYMHDNNIHIEDHVDPSMKADKRPFVGLIADVKRKIPWFLSDIKDALNVQCVAATIYIYLVSLCSLVAFGALLGQNTDNYMGTIETILSGAICGILFAIFSGQPLNLLSATGPMLILENILSSLCKQYDIDFLEFRLWIGIWIGIILFIFVLFNLSFLVKFITRFTEDCFASLVAILFIIDAFKSILKINKTYPAQIYGHDLTFSNSCNCLDLAETVNQTGIAFNETLCSTFGGNWTCSLEADQKYVPDVFFFSILVFVFTFIICMGLKALRDSPFFPTFVRQILSDFAVLIAILSMSIMDSVLKVNTPKLIVPSKLIPTRSEDRGWFIPFFEKNEYWTIFLAIVPAIIATMLIFMDQQITGVIVNRKEFKLKKGFGYHLDLFIVGISIVVCSVLGLPWFVAATVLAVAHINALKVFSENSAPGEKPKFIGVHEQRLTSLLVSILLGLSVFFTTVLSYIPMPVLYAVFLYMGVSTLGGLEVVDRILIIFMPAKYQPDYPFLKHVHIKRVHVFTFIQVASTAAMFTVKQIQVIAIGFPVLVVFTCFVRKVLDYVFTQRELYWLDNLLPNAKIEEDKINLKAIENENKSESITTNDSEATRF